MKVLDAKTHGYLDYAYGVLLLLAPAMFDFSPTAATISQVFGVLHLGLSLVTRYPLGAFKVVPFPVHGGIELVAAILLVAMPWLADFAADEAGRNFFVIAGIFVLGLWLVTDYRRHELARSVTEAFRRAS